LATFTPNRGARSVAAAQASDRREQLRILRRVVRAVLELTDSPVPSPGRVELRSCLGELSGMLGETEIPSQSDIDHMVDDGEPL